MVPPLPLAPLTHNGCSSLFATTQSCAYLSNHSKGRVKAASNGPDFVIMPRHRVSTHPRHQTALFVVHHRRRQPAFRLARQEAHYRAR